MTHINAESYKRAEMLYNYRLYSYGQLRTFSEYAWRTAKKVSENYGGSRLAIWLDMLWCNLRYGAMYDRDYLLFEFYRKGHRERDTFLTFRRYYKLIKHLDKDTFYSLMDKAFMYKKYADYIGRDWLLVDEKTSNLQIIEFIKKHDKIIVKPVSSDQGHGITFLMSSDVKNIETILHEKNNNTLLLESICKNCPEFNAINPSSLNTLRVYTVLNSNSEVIIPSISLRCGCGETVVDNWGSGGVGYPVDIESGVICAAGIDKNGKKYIIHPGSNVVMPGFKIPRFQDACKMAKEIIGKDKKVTYAGLDLAILPDRVELIEVNFPGGHDFLQALDLVGKNHLFDHFYES